ncbi:hypothetical protein [Treponema phagedenis]|uniref:hypothetical protein n=1 Tax=Treponema phagedenis TaxID=162 RepID=UPI000467168F|nr:hypothetical protein [Treponema phagedenis]
MRAGSFLRAQNSAKTAEAIAEPAVRRPGVRRFEVYCKKAPHGGARPKNLRVYVRWKFLESDLQKADKKTILLV